MATVLVVEDNKDLRMLIRLILEQAGYAVRDAADGPTALGILEDQAGPPLVVVADNRMPGMTGLELMRLMRIRPTLAAVPVVLLTGDRVAKSARPAPDGLLVKPFEAKDLLDVVGRLAHRNTADT